MADENLNSYTNFTSPQLTRKIGTLLIISGCNDKCGEWAMALG